jgi:hypothetical protein
MAHVRLNDPRTAHGAVVLVFENAERPLLGEVVALVRDVEALYWFCWELALGDAAPNVDPKEAGGFPLRVERLRLGSFEVVLQVPAPAWEIGAGLLFTGALAMVFRLPARFQEARESFWERRLAADEAKRKWLESKRAEWRDQLIRLGEMGLPEEAAEVLRERGEEP